VLTSPAGPFKLDLAVGAKGSSGKGDGTGKGCSKNESRYGKVSVDNGDAGGKSNWQQKRIKLQQQKAMRSAAAVIRSAKQDDVYGASNIVLPCPGS
jgi:hypothetical protein